MVLRWSSRARVLVLGTRGLSRRLEGKRASRVNQAFDLRFGDSPAGEPASAMWFGFSQFEKNAGRQGTELLNCLAARGPLTGPVREQHRNDHIPVSNEASGLMLFEDR